MTDITFLSPDTNQTILTTHIEAISRAGRESGVVNGNRVIPTIPASLAVTVEAGRIKIAGAPADVIEEEVALTAAHSTLPRVDIIYRDASGNAQVVDGTPATIEDPKNLSTWRSYTAPAPTASIPPGPILAAVYVGPAATSISASEIWMFGGGVGDISTVIATPGSDAYPPSEKATATGLAAKISTTNIATSIATPGVDTKVPSEKAVRTELASYAPSAKGVTNGDSHDHNGGDGAQVSHLNLSNIGTNAHSAVDLFIASKAAASGLASLDGSSVCAQAPKLHAAAHLSAGGDAIKLDDLAAPDANTDLNASTSAHGLMQMYPNTKQRLLGDGNWATPVFGVGFTFGDGSAVIAAGERGVKLKAACKITGVSIREQALISSGATVTIHVHDVDAAIGSAVDTFTLSSVTYLEEGSLSWAVAAGKWITCKVASPTAAKQLIVMLDMEAT